MSATPPRSAWVSEQAPHRARRIAESFGQDPERYDRMRARYPEAMVRRIVAASPGTQILDVGCGTGIVARQFQAAGCTVLGIDVDARMAEFARGAGTEVEVCKFEEWDGAGRTFDAIVSGQAWHWVDPVAGALKAARVLRPEGRLAVFWNVQQPPDELGEAFSAVYQRVLPGTPFARGAKGGREAYSGFFVMAAEGMREAGAFGEVEQWQFDWEATHTREEWLDYLPTAGGHNQLPPGALEELLRGIGAAIDAAGGSFTMRYCAVVATAQRKAAAS